jgi:hypothetical protein
MARGGEMTDRELLEAAAKAAGIEGFASEFQNGYVEMGCTNYFKPNGSNVWTPLADDGDALRLAVKLGISFRRMGVKVIAIGHSQCDEYCNDDANAATRRAIVRAAAAMAKEKAE